MAGSSRQLDALLGIARAHADERLLFLVALDGVLAKYRTDPDRVQVPPGRRALLQRLLSVPRVAVGVVSGRRLRDLQERARLGDAAFYVGLHGLEAVGPGFVRVHPAVGDEYRGRLLDMATRLHPTLAGVPGVRLEFKDLGLALHTLDAGSEDAVWSRVQLLRAATDLVNADAARIVRGHHVLEVLPNVSHSRARAIAAIQRSLQQRHHETLFTVYIGEDATDDDAFKALERRAVGVVVGRRRPEADYHLSDASDVDRFMEGLIAQRAQTGSSARDERLAR